MKETESTNPPASQLSFAPGPPAIVYKTRADYSDKVAVILNEDKTAIASYPHPRDIARPSGLPYPTLLAGGYLLDNQGITPQVAFTRYTMAEYGTLQKAPSEQALMESIIDKTPLLEMCHCGNRSQYQDAAAALSKLVAQGLLPCKKLLE